MLCFHLMKQVFPAVKSLPAWVGPGGLELCDGVFSINVLAPFLLVGLTIILCQGVKESSMVNDVMTVTKVRTFSPRQYCSYFHYCRPHVLFWRTR